MEHLSYPRRSFRMSLLARSPYTGPMPDTRFILYLLGILFCVTCVTAFVTLATRAARECYKWCRIWLTRWLEPDPEARRFILVFCAGCLIACAAYAALFALNFTAAGRRVPLGLPPFQLPFP
jgi:hypothetical protein